MQQPETVENTKQKIIESHEQLIVIKNQKLFENDFPKSFPELYEIKTLNFKKYDDHLKHVSPCIKNRLFEITNEFKDFKFPKKQLRIYLKKKKEILMQTYGFINTKKYLMT